MKSHFHQGIALITALLVVALVTITAIAIIVRQQLDIHRTANILYQEQAYLYALGTEQWAKRILWRDAQSSTFDHFHEVWALQLPPLPIPGGNIQAHLEDLQSRFNLNNLVLSEQGQEDLHFLERLLTLLELPPTLAQVVMDWIDSDQDTWLADGAEDNIYLLKTTPYRTANTLLSSPSELRLLNGFDNATVQKLLPYISTLPTRTAINLNTAPVPILMALVAELDESKAMALIAAREKKPFATVQDFLAQEALAGLKVEAKNLAVASNYFLLTTVVQIDRAQAQLKSLFYRLPPTIAVIMRSRGEI